MVVKVDLDGIREHFQWGEFLDPDFAEANRIILADQVRVIRGHVQPDQPEE